MYSVILIFVLLQSNLTSSLFPFSNFSFCLFIPSFHFLPLRYWIDLLLTSLSLSLIGGFSLYCWCPSCRGRLSWFLNKSDVSWFGGKPTNHAPSCIRTVTRAVFLHRKLWFFRFSLSGFGWVAISFHSYLSGFGGFLFRPIHSLPDSIVFLLGSSPSRFIISIVWLFWSIWFILFHLPVDLVKGIGPWFDGRWFDR